MSCRSSLKPFLFILSFFLLIACAEKKAYSEALEPKALFEKRCSRCHSLDKISRAESREGWARIVNKMKKKFFSGISNEDASVIIEYLFNTMGLRESTAAPAANTTPDK